MIIVDTSKPEFLKTIDSDFIYFRHFVHMYDEFTMDEFKKTLQTL